MGTIDRRGGGPTVSVIIPVRDDLAGLRRCLAALDRQSFPRELMEIIVVDNGSRTPIDDVMVVTSGVTVIREARPGSYAARNTGVSVARGELLAFTDADCMPSVDWLANGVAFMSAHTDCGLMAGRIDVRSRRSQPSIAEQYEVATAFRQEIYAADHFAATANAWVRRTTFAHVGGFAAGLTSGGDAEFGKRVHAAGIAVCYGDDVRVAHPARTLRPLLAKQARVGAGLRDRHAIAPPKRRVVIRLAIVRLLPYVAAAKVVRRLPPSTDALRRLRVMALALAVRQLYFWSYLLHRPGPVDRPPDEGRPSSPP